MQTAMIWVMQTCRDLTVTVLGHSYRPPVYDGWCIPQSDPSFIILSHGRPPELELMERKQWDVRVEWSSFYKVIFLKTWLAQNPLNTKTNTKETKYDPVKDKSNIVRISPYTNSKHVNLIRLYLLTGKTNERFTLWMVRYYGIGLLFSKHNLEQTLYYWLV